MINIHVDNIYACHLGFFAFLLKLEYNIITPSSNLLFDFYNTDYKYYYTKLINILNKETLTYLELGFFDYYLKNNLNIFTSVQTPGIDIYIPNDPFKFNNITDMFIPCISKIEQAEYYLRQALDTILPVKLDLYFVDRNENRNIISWTILNMYNRSVSPEELKRHYYHNGFNLRDKIDLFQWLLILYFCPEGRLHNYHLPFFLIIKEIRHQLLIPVTALILSGFTEDFITYYDSHKVFIDNPYIDIYIHTWSTRGDRYEYHTEQTDINDLINLYNPINIQIEDIHTHEFSYVNDFDLLFFKNTQEHDDASRYLNPRLYSLYKAYELIDTTKYKIIMRLNFNMNIINFDYKQICMDISRDAFYVNNKGCERCDMEITAPLYYTEKSHPYHFNDIGSLWFYANVNIGSYACKLYSNLYNITYDAYQTNVANYLSIPYRQYRKFVYILGKNDTVQCLYEPTLWKIYMKEYWCLSSKSISFTFIESVY